MSFTSIAALDTEKCTKLVGPTGTKLQVCEAYRDGMRTSQETAERVLKENMLHKLSQREPLAIL